MQATTESRPSARPAFLQRKCGCGGACGPCSEAKKRPLRRSAAGDAALSVIPPIVHDVLASPGEPLAPSVRARMETSFGHDFSRVRVHADGRAAESAQAVYARAYTVGDDIVFQRGAYDPSSSRGIHLLAHELAHVVQHQRGLSRSAGAGAISSPHDASELEADRAADRVAGGGGAGRVDGAASAPRHHDASGVAADRASAPQPPREMHRSARAGTISSPHDASELEADRAADRVASGAEAGPLGAAPSALHRAPCPAPPTHLGDSPPPAPCETPAATRSGHAIHFCADSDEPLAGEAASIPPLIPILSALQHVEVHGYASVEGPTGRAAAYNLALSCHRAHRVAALLVSHGIAASRIRRFQHGGTNAFSTAAPANRVVMIVLPSGGSTQINRMRVAALSFLSCAPCNPFTDDGTLGLTPPPAEPPVGSSYRMKHWIEAWVHSADGRTIAASGITSSGAVAGESGYCGTTSPAAIVRRLGPLSGGISSPLHGEAMVFDSELVTRVNAVVPPTLPDAPCGALGTNPMIPPISNRFRMTLYADGTRESEFLGASSYPFHYLYEDGALKTLGGSPVHPAVDFPAWATSTGVSLFEAEVGFKALGSACCAGGTGLPACPSVCRGGTTHVAPPLPGDPAIANFMGCMGVAAGLALTSCTSSRVRCATAGGTCSPPTLPSHP